MASIIKDIGKIWTRLFDHRPFIQGEVTFFLHEFQNKRNNKEVLQLLKILEYSLDLGQRNLDYTEQHSDCNLLSLKVNVDITLSMCDYILQKENIINRNNKLKRNKEICNNEREKYKNDIKKKYKEIDRDLHIKNKELEKFYVDVEKKLHILC